MNKPAFGFLPIIAAILLLLSCSFDLSKESNPPDEQSLTVYVMGFAAIEKGMKSAADEYNLYRARDGLHSVRIEASYAPSSKMAEKIMSGTPCQLAILEDDNDRKLLEAKGLAGKRNMSLARFGVILESPLVILVRKGNPTNIHSLSDLSSSGRRLILPDPEAERAGLWSIIAIYQAALNKTNNLDAARSALLAYRQNIAAQPTSIEEAIKLLKNGTGEALPLYEVDAMNAVATDNNLEIIIPTVTMRCEFVICLMDTSGTAEQRDTASSFGSYMVSEKGQFNWTNVNFLSPLYEKLNPPTRHAGIKTFLRVDEIGGFVKARADIYDGIWRKP